ncbi:hypothetical protein GFGA_1d0983 [Gluconobacter frateurii NBRC 103465]|nr:hypothetical protein GFGA_1d0983 [Gluconobacter frateurii NBRC 103465]
MTDAVAGIAVRFYRTVSPLPATCSRRNSPAGGLFSVALSLGSPPPAVSRYRFPMEPGLSSMTGILIPVTAIVQPSGGRTLRRERLRVKGRLSVHLSP